MASERVMTATCGEWCVVWSSADDDARWEFRAGVVRAGHCHDSAALNWWLRRDCHEQTTGRQTAADCPDLTTPSRTPSDRRHNTPRVLSAVFQAVKPTNCLFCAKCRLSVLRNIAVYSIYHRTSMCCWHWRIQGGWWGFEPPHDFMDEKFAASTERQKAKRLSVSRGFAFLIHMLLDPARDSCFQRVTVQRRSISHVMHTILLSMYAALAEILCDCKIQK